MMKESIVKTLDITASDNLTKYKYTGRDHIPITDLQDNANQYESAIEFVFHHFNIPFPIYSQRMEFFNTSTYSLRTKKALTLNGS
jgi:hypothetical protein